MTMPWREKAPLRWSVALVLAFTFVAMAAFVMERLVESLTRYSYTIHWLETVPFLVVALAWIIQRQLQANLP